MQHSLLSRGFAVAGGEQCRAFLVGTSRECGTCLQELQEGEAAGQVCKHRQVHVVAWSGKGVSWYIPRLAVQPWQLSCSDQSSALQSEMQPLFG